MSIDGGLRQIFREHLLGFDWQSIESGTTGGGIPDANYCARGGIEGWVEMKQTPGWTVPLLPAQIGWIARRVRYGGRVWVAVRQKRPVGRRTGPVDALWLIPGELAREAKLGGLRAMGALVGTGGVDVWPGGPARWNWDAVARMLVQ